MMTAAAPAAAETTDARPAHPVVAALAGACAGVSGAADSAIFGLADEDLAATVGECERLRALTHHLQLTLVREVGARGLPRQAGAASAAAWLAGRFRLPPGEARRLVRIAGVTGEVAEPVDYSANVGSGRTGRELAATAAALAEGLISPEHVTAVAAVLGKMPNRIEADVAAQVERELAGFCLTFDPGVVTKLGEQLLEALSEDSTLDDDERERHRRRFLSLDEATGRIRGQLTREQIALLRTALDPLAAPDPAADGTSDQRTAQQRMADALGELARRAIAADIFENNHGMAHRVMVTIELGALATDHQHHETGDTAAGADDDRATADGAGDAGSGANGAGVSGEDGHSERGSNEHPATPGGTCGCAGACGIGTRACVIPVGKAAGMATVQWGGQVSAAAARLIACHASIQRVVLDPAGAVLDVGREYRTATPSQFAALIARDGGCAFPGCARPLSWCIAHHIKHWADGGLTNLDNLVLLCGHHHRVVHFQGWTVQIDPNDRLPTFHPPRWITPDHSRQRNPRPRHPGRPGRARRPATTPPHT